jgi:predicted HD phosphohydrolase
MELRSVEELMDLLYGCRGAAGTPDHRSRPVDLHDHALRTAALLRRRRPADKELQVAGLVHDIGHLLRPGTGAGSSGRSAAADRAAAAVRGLLGERVFRLLRQQADAGEDVMRDEDALALRQADEEAHTTGLDAGVLEDWRTVLELVAAQAARTCQAAGNQRLGATD